MMQVWTSEDNFGELEPSYFYEGSESWAQAINFEQQVLKHWPFGIDFRCTELNRTCY